MSKRELIAKHRDAILALPPKHGATNVRVFGSVARGQDQEGSDVDLLVDMPAGSSLLALVRLQLVLQDALGARIGLCTERELHPMLRERILAEARAL